MVHHGLTTVWPPVTVVPASKAESLKPLMISGTTTSLSFSVILVLTPNNISILSHSVTPIAYKSLMTFAHAILPKNNLDYLYLKLFSSKLNYNINLSFFKSYPSCKDHRLRGRKNLSSGPNWAHRASTELRRNPCQCLKKI